MPTLTCEQALSLVVEPRSGPVPAGEAVDLTRHLRGCDDCRNGMIACREAIALVDGLRAGRLERDDAVALAAHLAGCDRCRARADEMRQSQALLEVIETPASVADRLSAAAAEHLTRQLRARALRTPFGWNALAYSDGGIILIERSEGGETDAYERLSERLEDFIVQERPRDDLGRRAVDKLAAYYEGRRPRFSEPLDFSLATPFIRDVLQATSRIPYGQVRPYAWVAREIGRPRAFRAVGQALHVNPLAPIVPCHRVIASDNTLGGYGGGLPMKESLLRMEGYLH
ncbi:MAG: methylated-DNA--[protein]-cysteine S-methyltransferase [Dehalococcoidia bacterium]